MNKCPVAIYSVAKKYALTEQAYHAQLKDANMKTAFSKAAAGSRSTFKSLR